MEGVSIESSAEVSLHDVIDVDQAGPAPAPNSTFVDWRLDVNDLSDAAKQQLFTCFSALWRTNGVIDIDRYVGSHWIVSGEWDVPGPMDAEYSINGVVQSTI